MFFLFPPQCCWAASSAPSCSPSSSWPSVSTGPSAGGSGAGPAGTSRECCIPPCSPTVPASLQSCRFSRLAPTAPHPSGSPIWYPPGSPVRFPPSQHRSGPARFSPPVRTSSRWGCAEDASVAFHPSLPALCHQAPS